MSNLLEGQVKLNPTIDFLAGTISGITGLLVGYPFDTVKVRFQNPETASKYKTTFDAVRTIVKEEKVLGLYKGVTSPLTTAALWDGLLFSSYKFFTRLQLDYADQVPTLMQVALAGAGSGVVTSFIATPVELIKIRQQSSLSLTRIPTLQVAYQIYKSSGFFGLYRGFSATALREPGSAAAYFFVYEAIRRLFSHSPSDAGGTEPESIIWPVLLLAGGVAGVLSWVVTFPFDVVKTRMQQAEPRLPISDSDVQRPLLSSASDDGTSSATQADSANPFRSLSSTIVHSYRTEGLGVFYRGLGPTVIRAFPVNMVAFATYEAVVHVLT